ncbi:hypothetical protein TKK_0001519 [Trichogramma kaykai]|uniref:Small ribosomal subunit protein mS26 n=1 Tax=Trichogramma kaykai TaxID=54128 RepID=A0ABD2X1T9_9HYME
MQAIRLQLQTHNCNFVNLTSIYAQSIRWKRKPIWLPTAKTKVFRVTQRPKIPEEEFLKIKNLYNVYRTSMKSIRLLFLQIGEASQVQEDKGLKQKEMEEDYHRCFALNEEWNKKIAEEREVRLQQERKQKLERIKNTKVKVASKLKKLEEEADAIVKGAKLLAPTFITRDNIDEAIEAALANKVNYNKALNPDGTWFIEKPVNPNPSAPIVDASIKDEQKKIKLNL